MSKRLHVIYPLAYKSIDEIAGNRNQVGIEGIDALYYALEARTARRCGAMKIAEVDDAVAVKRLRKIVVLYFDAIHVGSPHALVYSPCGKSCGDNGERGKYAACRPHGNAYLRKTEQIAQDVIRKRQRQKQHHRRIYPAIAQDYGWRKIRRELVAANSREESKLAEREGKQC